MPEIVNESLQKIAKGTTIVFIGTFVCLFLGFVGRVILVRYTTQTEYGIYSLALVITSIFVTISTLGLGEGSTRYIAYFRGKKEEGKIRDVISSSIKIAIIAGVLLSILLFFLSDIISIKVFHSPELSTPLKIFSIAIPFTVLINLFIATFRGFDRVDARIYFNDIIRPAFYLLFLIAAVLFGLSFLGMVYAYVLSLVVTCVVFVIYLMKKYSLSIRSGSSVINPITKQLLFFSVPVLAVSMIRMVISQTDMLMLGYFKTPDVVGIYNVALPLSQFVWIVASSMGFIYVPIVSQLYSKNLIEEIRRSYISLTKWIFLMTLPIFFVLFLFPDIVLNLLFGSRYIGAATALQILALGFFLDVSLGLPSDTLLVLGKSKFLMWASLFGAIMNIILNVALIPPLDIVGASIASVLSLLTVKAIYVIKLHKDLKINPFTKIYLKIAGLLVLFLLIFYIIRNLVTISIWTFLALFSLFLVSYGLSVLFTKSFDEADIAMLLTIEKGLGIDLAAIKRIFKRFI